MSHSSALPPNETVTAKGRPSASALDATWETSRTAGPLQPLWVKRNPPRVVTDSSPLAAVTVASRETPESAACAARRARERNERGKEGTNRVAQEGGPVEARRVRSPGEDRATPGGENDAGSCESVRVEADVEATLRPERDLSNRRARTHFGPGGPSVRDERVADVPGAVRRRVELGRLQLFAKGPPQDLLEEGALRDERKAVEEAIDEPSWRGGDEACPSLAHREDVAVPPPGDEDFPPRAREPPPGRRPARRSPLREGGRQPRRLRGAPRLRHRRSRFRSPSRR